MIILTDPDPCKIKLAMRTDYYRRFKIDNPARSAREALDRAYEFWPRYEQVNRDYCPDDPVYSTVRAGAALSTTADHLHFKAAASGQTRLLEYIFSGEATVSAVNRVAIAYMNATLAGASALTPEKWNSRSSAAAGTYGHSNTSALLAANLQVWAVNAFGGFIDWKAAPGEEIYIINGEVMSLRSLSGTSTFSSTAVFEEL
jgi:hypothetical protein